jgi:hypothetical protein
VDVPHIALSGKRQSWRGFSGISLGPYQVWDGFPRNWRTPVAVPQAAPTVRGSTKRTKGVVVDVVVVVAASGGAVRGGLVVETAMAVEPDDPAR